MPDEKSTELKDIFRSIMRGVASTVMVLATRTDGNRHGMTATAFTSVSFDPLSVLVCVNNRGALHAAIHSSQMFSVNVLSCDDVAVSSIFSSPLTSEERFAKGMWNDRDGVPYLESAQAVLFCNNAQAIPFGTHTVFIAEVVDGNCGSDHRPLLYMNGQYGRYANATDAR